MSKTFHGTKRAAAKALAALDTEAADGRHGRPDTVGMTVAELRLHVPVLLEPKATVRVPTAEQVRRILNEAERSDPMLGRVFMLAADRAPPWRALCRGELCALRWRDVDLDTGRLRIAASVQEVPGRLAVKDTKRHQTQVIALDDAGVTLLRLHRKESKSERPAPASRCPTTGLSSPRGPLTARW